MTPELSIIIPTYKRHTHLEKALKTVNQYRPPSSEVIVVDQSPDHKKYATHFCKVYPYIKYIHLSSPSLPKARNAGIVNCSGDIIFFMDDDTIVDPACLNEHISYHARNGVYAIAGRIKQMGEVSWANISDVTVIDNDTGEATGNFDLDHETEVLYASGGHMSVKRDIIKKVGLFNPRFKGNALYEDVEFFARVRKKGYAIKYDPRAIVYHYPDTNGGCHESKGSTYLTERLYNHMLFYILHRRIIPSKKFIIYIKNLMEYISRKKNKRHSIIKIGLCIVSIIEAYWNAFLSFFTHYKLKK
jgi:GT2 family glycosyltransferase